MQFKESLSYDDVLLVPQYSEVASRSQVDLTVKLPKKFHFKNPIIPANMKTVSGKEMAKFIADLGGLAIVHRFMSLEDQLDIVNYFVIEQLENYVGFSVGVKEENKNDVDSLVNLGAKILCIDIAHGDSKMCIDMCNYISQKYPHVLLIAGNVATGLGAQRLWDAGADVVKVGIGPGSLCTTRIETAAGVPQLSAVIEVAQTKNTLKNSGIERFKNREIAFIADGGIKSAGDIVKALCFADMVMVGNLFAGTEEAPGDVKTINGKLYKEYVGSSTHKGSRVEGVEAVVPFKGPAKTVMTRLVEGLQSGCSYQGANNLSELKEFPTFVKITAGGLRESHPHDVILK